MPLETPDILIDPRTQTSTKDAHSTPWMVVVYNDPVNLMSYVTMVFQKVFGYPKEKAEHHMMEVHEKGRSIVWCGVRERAEFFVERLQAFLLLAALERQSE